MTTTITPQKFTPAELAEISALPLLTSEKGGEKTVTLSTGRTVRQYIWRRKTGAEDRVTLAD